jgi:hypothetical protein
MGANFPGCYSPKPKLQQRGKKKPGSVNRALCIFDLTVLFSLDPLFSVLSFSF